MSGANVHKAQGILADNVTPQNAAAIRPQGGRIVRLSRTGKNVVAIMLDRALTGFVPYIFEGVARASGPVRGLGMDDSLILGDGYDAEWCACLLMVKGFGASECATSDDFMTNADVPTLAFAGTVDDPVNSDVKVAGLAYVTSSDNYDIYTNNGNQLDLGGAMRYGVSGNVYDRSNWFQAGTGQLPEHK